MNPRALFGSSNNFFFFSFMKIVIFWIWEQKPLGTHLALDSYTWKMLLFSSTYLLYLERLPAWNEKPHYNKPNKNSWISNSDQTNRERERERILFVRSRFEICCLIGSSSGLVDSWWLSRQHVGVCCVLSLVFLWW